MQFRIVRSDQPWWLVLAAAWAAAFEAMILDGIPGVSPLVPPVLAFLTFCLSLAYYLWRQQRGSYLEVSHDGIRRVEPIPFVGSSWRLGYERLASIELSVSGRLRFLVRYPPALVKDLPPEKHYYAVSVWVADPHSFETALRLHAPSHVKISWVSRSLEELDVYVFDLPASFLRRTTAFALDAAFAFLLIMTTSVILLIGDVVRDGWVWFGSPAIWFLYTWTANALGQSEGKRVTGLRVEALSGGPPGVWPGLRRTVGQLAIDFTWGIGYLWVLTNPERRGLHDLLAGTRVVRAVPRQAVSQAANLAPQSQKAVGP